MKKDDKSLIIIVIVSILIGVFCGVTVDVTNILSNILIALGVFFLFMLSLTTALIQGR